MTSEITQNPDDALADRLAAAAGVGALAAAAAIDAEEGDEFLQSLLADEMAAAHLLTMRMAALADRAIAAAADAAGADREGAAGAPVFDRAAVRFAGAAARLNGRCCQGLKTLQAVADDEDDVLWYAIDWDGSGKTLPPEEFERRLNRAAFYRKRNRAAEAVENKPIRPRIEPAEEATLAAAEEAASDLLDEAGVADLADDSHRWHIELFAHQLAAAHRLMMRLSGRADAVVGAAAEPFDQPEGLRLVHGAARLMERVRQGVAMLHRLRATPDRPRPIGYLDVSELTEEEREAERQEDIANGLDPDTGLPAEAPLGAKAGRLLQKEPSPSPCGTHTSRSEQNFPRPLRAGARGRGLRAAARQRIGIGTPDASTLDPRRRGRLRNGNPGGDFLAAPRCGAKTRAGQCCRQPAMANGRCRFHGGKSTGPRTAAGLARARGARRVHGLRSAEVIALSSAAAAAHRRLGTLLARLGRQTTEDRRQKGAEVRRPSTVVRPLTPAGHGVHRSKSNVAAGGAVVLPFVRPPSSVAQASRTSHDRPRAVPRHCRSRIRRLGS